VKKGLAFVLSCLTWVVLISAAAAQGNTTGSVVNGTAGAALPGGLNVTVHQVQSDGEIILHSRANTDAQGRFAVDTLGLPAGTNLVASAEYLGVSYYSAPFSFQEGQLSASPTITIYETSALPNYVICNPLHLIVEVADGTLRFQEIVYIQNAADRTFVGWPDPTVTSAFTPTLHFSLPPEATDLTIGSDGQVDGTIRSADGFYETSPLLPGTTEYSFSYSCPYTTATYTLEKAFFYPTPQFNLLVTDVGIRIDSPQLTQHGSRQMGTSRYLFSSAMDIQAGARIPIVLSNLPQPSTTQAASSAPRGSSADLILKWLILAAGAAFLLWTLSRPLLRRGHTASLETSAASPHEEREALLHALASLDNRFAAGKLEADDYARQRIALKDRLVQVWPESEELP